MQLEYLIQRNTQKRTIFSIIISVTVMLVIAVGGNAATLRLPGNCSSVSSCISSMSSGDTLIISDGTYGDSISGVRSNTTIEAENDGKVRFTGNFNPGSAGFTMRGIVVKGGSEKTLGRGNTYDRMSFVGGPSSGNTKNSNIGSGTTITNSAFYGRGGRYLLMAYQENGAQITLRNIIFRPDGGWDDSKGDPVAALNFYDTENFNASGLVLIDAVDDSNNEVIGGIGVNTHSGHGYVGEISNSVITACNEANFGAFYSDGNGSHNVTITDSVAKGNSYGYGLTRNVGGTTTATRFDTDKGIGQWDGRISRTSGANLVLNFNFLNDPRWKQEMCTDAGVTRGFCGTSMYLGNYVASKTGLPIDTNSVAAPNRLRVVDP